VNLVQPRVVNYFIYYCYPGHHRGGTNNQYKGYKKDNQKKYVVLGQTFIPPRLDKTLPLLFYHNVTILLQIINEGLKNVNIVIYDAMLESIVRNHYYSKI